MQCQGRGLMRFPVGVNNHRQFIVFVTALVIGIVMFDYLTLACKYLLLTIRNAH